MIIVNFVIVYEDDTIHCVLDDDNLIPIDKTDFQDWIDKKDKRVVEDTYHINENYEGYDRTMDWEEYYIHPQVYQDMAEFIDEFKIEGCLE